MAKINVKIKFLKSLRMLFVSGAIIVLLLCPILSAHADAIITQYDWDPLGDNLWTSRYSRTTIDYPAAGGVDNSGWMRIKFPATAQPAGNTWWDIISTPADNLFAGPWTPEMSLGFSLWSSNVAPAKLAVRFGSTNDTYIWGNEITVPSSVGTWNTVGVSFQNWEEWKWDFLPGLNEDMYLDDLAAIDWIGIYLRRSTDAEEIYGIDNFQLMIPEPGEYTMLAAALITSTVSLRRRKKRCLPAS